MTANEALNEAVESKRQLEVAAEKLAALENVPAKKGTLEERIAATKTPEELQAVMAQAELEATQEAISAQVKAQQAAEES